MWPATGLGCGQALPCLYEFIVWNSKHKATKNPGLYCMDYVALGFQFLFSDTGSVGWVSNLCVSVTEQTERGKSTCPQISSCLWIPSKDLNIFSCSFLQLEGTNAYSAFLSRNRSLQWFGHSPETQELLGLRHCSVSECSGSHIWEPHRRPLDSLARSRPKPWLHTLYQWVWWQWQQLTLTECLLNARHPHRTTDVLVPLSHKCGNWGREL